MLPTFTPQQLSQTLPTTPLLLCMCHCLLLLLSFGGGYDPE
jgi:hypothetical protein